MASELRVKELFLAACELAPRERAAYLTAQCGSDATLRELVENLLLHEEEAAEDFLIGQKRESGEPGDAASAGETLRRVGRFAIVRRIGEGGMGVVYEARQDQPHRTVALKLIRPGMASRQLLKRFEHEAEILGQLQHPGIACIYEAGVAQVEADRGGNALAYAQQPYFAMEFVRGRAITEYCSFQGLGIRERLALFAQVCDAVQHAHLKGVIHRDLKPANILVVEEGENAPATPRGNEGVAGPAAGAMTLAEMPAEGSRARPKILDFGVARLTNSDVQTVTLQTHAGQLIGTIPYMSPEQVAGNSQQLDTRSDVYALGVVLYEMLAERLPHDLRDRSIPESARIIREEEPSRLGSIDTHFRGDIETIVCKAIEKDKQRRYGSAAELAADVRRYLRHEPILARRASRYYRLRKFARRHWAIVYGSTAAFAFLLAGLLIALWQASIAVHARDDEIRQRHVAERQAYRASLAAAQAALRSDDALLAQRSLEDAPTELRGWEWSHFRSMAEPPAIVLPNRGSIIALMASRDAARVFVATQDRVMSVWDTATRTVRRRFEIDPDVGWSCSADGTRVLIGRANELAMYEAETGRLMWRRSGHARIRCAAFRDDGRVCVVAMTDESRAALLDTTKGDEVGSVRMNAAQFGSIGISPDGRLMISLHGSYNDVFDAASGAHLFGFNGYGWFMADGKRILNGDVIRDARTGAELRKLEMSPYGAGSFLERPDGTTLAHNALRGVVTLIDERTMQTIGRMRVSGARSISGDGRKLLAVDANGTIRVMDAHFVTLPLAAEPCNPEELNGAAIATREDGAGTRDVVATGGWGCVTLRDALTGGPCWRMNVSHQDVRALGFSRDGRILAAAGKRGTMALLDAETGRLRARCVIAGGGDVVTTAFSADGARIFAGMTNGMVRSARVEAVVSGDAAWSEAFAAKRGSVTCIMVSPNGKRVMIAGVREHAGQTEAVGQLEIWDAAAERLVRRIDAHRERIDCIAFDAAGTTMALASADGTVSVWNADGERRVMTLASGSTPIESVCFSPDDSRIATGAADGTIHLFDRASGQELCGIRDFSTGISALRFSADGGSLVGSATESPLLMLETKTVDSLAETRERVERAVRVVGAQWPEYVLADEKIQRIEKDTTLPPDVRKEAARLAGLLGDNVNWLNSNAWEHCRSAGGAREEYERALEQARRAVDILPEPAFLNTLGTAEFRLGHDAEAIDALRRSEEGYLKAGMGAQPANWLVTAMAQQRLGQTEAARRSLEKGRTLMRDAHHAIDADEQEFLVQAERAVH